MNGENLKYFGSSKKFYDSLCKRVVNKKIVIDLFAFSLEEIGLTEMSELIFNSGGFVAMHEEFSHHIFQNSFKKVTFMIFSFFSMLMLKRVHLEFRVSRKESFLFLLQKMLQ